MPRNLLIEEATHPKDRCFLQYVEEASSYAHGVGVESIYLWDERARRPRYEVIDKIKAMQMMTHMWTFKDDHRIFGKNYLVTMERARTCIGSGSKR